VARVGKGAVAAALGEGGDIRAGGREGVSAGEGDASRSVRTYLSHINFSWPLVRIYVHRHHRYPTHLIIIPSMSVRPEATSRSRVMVNN